MTREEVRDVIREELNEMAGGPWNNIASMVQAASARGLVQDIGQRGVGRTTTHEFEISGRVFEIREIE
jgi:hypothetical protein